MTKLKKICFVAVSAALCSAFSLSAVAEEIQIAVAANFTAPAKDLAPVFEKQTGHKVKLSFGGTGAFFAQIENGAPFDILLAADAKTPAKIEQKGLGVKGSSFTYALGKLVFWSSDPAKIDSNGNALKEMKFAKCAVADPKLAPYGEASYQTLESFKLLKAYEPKFVTGNNIGKTFQFVKTGNAEVGFVALSQVFKNGKFTSGSGWVIPAKYYRPIRQDAVLLNHGAKSDAAKAFLKFLQSPESNKLKESYGYGIH
ncbi:MAG: molybdate ABC transporter substrate-binding protein [Sutterellaceae bacterium]|nr:molybdate ABC transporter substrate-binding protein [Sutterellaceae bacterium]MDD7441859.1 molybdate ABC transporter substrate-binding protein [Sutterellaceae bacterium]MDY2867709.1 molybdate ABC transporter substrate-binding protein [Mesosutterella sp.]